LLTTYDQQLNKLSQLAINEFSVHNVYLDGSLEARQRLLERSHT